MTVISMVLAHGPGLPDGDITDRLTLTAALTPHGQLDPEQDGGTTLRERPGQADKGSALVPHEGAWVLQGLHGDDEPLWTIDAPMLRPGEPVILRRPDGEELIYRIVALESK